jgi:hypothetical protein
MRCFFLKDGHIVSVELMPDLSDEEAVEKSHRLFAQAHKGRFDGFEVWELARFVFRYEDQAASVSSSSPNPEAPSPS